MSINKVAELAGVSTSTVSRVINNHPRVAPETVVSVRKAMKELGYTPSDRRPGPKPSARNKLTTANIAFLVFGTRPDHATPAFTELLYGVSTAASQFDLNLVFSHVPDPEELPNRVMSKRVDGMLLHGARPSAGVRDRLAGIPTVWLMGNRRRPEWGDQVMPDGYTIGELAARHLLRQGHEKLAFLNLDSGHWPFRVYGHAFSVTAADEGGQVIAIEDSAPQVGPEYWPKHRMDAVERLVSRYLDLDDRPTGLFVADDTQVAMIQPALQARGVTLGPGSVEIVSCNNERPYIVGLSPRPAEIDIRAASIGRRGVEQLLWRLEHPELTERVVSTVEPKLVLPESVEAAAAATHG
jgi:LacI family transcriptional regulator